MRRKKSALVSLILSLCSRYNQHTAGLSDMGTMWVRLPLNNKDKLGTFFFNFTQKSSVLVWSTMGPNPPSLLYVAITRNRGPASNTRLWPALTTKVLLSILDTNKPQAKETSIISATCKLLGKNLTDSSTPFKKGFIIKKEKKIENMFITLNFKCVLKL